MRKMNTPPPRILRVLTEFVLLIAISLFSFVLIGCSASSAYDEAMTSVVFYIVFAIIALIIVIFLCIVRPIIKKSEYNSKESNIYVGMTEAEMIAKCGTPTKTVTIDSSCKLVSYTMDEWKGVLFGGSKHHEITATVKDGIVTNISTSD